ncbi:MAG: lysine--tRNA ligase, partial [Ruminococcus sp.]|nr:lysine--tRNA ligase [Ruminococcus sp.]
MNENQANPTPTEEQEQDINILKKVRLEKLAELKNRNADPFTVTKYDVNAKAAELKAKYETDEARIISEADGDEEKVKEGLEEIKAVDFRLAGRIMSWRNMGKANFIDIRDGSDRIQVYVRQNDIGKEEFAEFKKWDIGDIIGVEGFVFRTRMGEISIHA